MKILLARCHENASIPEKANESDFCYDLRAVRREQLAPRIYKYYFGWKLQIVRRQEPVFWAGENTAKCIDLRDFIGKLSIDFRPRSSVWKTGMVLSNCEPTIDEGFTGEVSAVFYHLLEDMPIYEVGDKVVQMKIGFTLNLDFDEVPFEQFLPTDRGSNGYGSSGK